MLNSFQTSGNSPGGQRCRVGILGFGAVGSALAGRLTGPDSIPILEFTHVCDRRSREKRARQFQPIDHIHWTDCFDDLLTSDVDVIVELAGGAMPIVPAPVLTEPEIFNGRSDQRLAEVV